MIGIASKAPYLAWPEPTSWGSRHRATLPVLPSRSMELESVGLGGAAAFREVRVQSVVVEFLLTHVDVLFSDTFTSAGLDPAGMPIHPRCPDYCPLIVRAAAGGQVGSQPHPYPTEAGPPFWLLEDPAPASPSPPPPSHFSSYAQDPHFLARTSFFLHPL